MTLHKGDYEEVLKEIKANLILTSPPYNIGSRSPRIDGQRKFGKFDPKSFGAIRDYPDNIPEDTYQKQQIKFLCWAADHLLENGILVYNHKPRRKNGCLIHPAGWFSTTPVKKKLILADEIIWDRGSTHNHGRGIMWPQTERLYVFYRRGDKYCLNNTSELPQRSDIWRINKGGNRAHCAPFPLELAKAVIMAWSKPSDLVLDPYMGSGTTGIAARMLGRNFAGAERLKKYYDLANSEINGVLELAA